jgi:hypothetical protein
MAGKMRSAEYYRCWDNHTWDTDFIQIPADTAEGEIEGAIRDAVAKRFKGKETEAPAFVGLYNSNDDGEDEDEEG